MHLTRWAVTLAVFWLLLSGFFQTLLLIFGAISVALVVYVVARMDHVDQEQKAIDLSPGFLGYCVWLLGQIVLSSVHVAKLVWGSPDKLAPALGQIKTGIQAEQGKVLYANSITLTPGTLSVDLVDDTITVHALQADSLQDLQQGAMQQRIAKIAKGNQK